MSMLPGFNPALSEFAALYAEWTTEWNRSLDALENSLSRNALASPQRPCVDKMPEWCSQMQTLVARHPNRSACETRAARRKCARTCGLCASRSRRQQLTESVRAAPGSGASCTLVATRHIAKTGGASARDWMLQLERVGRARFFGPVTWMPYRGRCDGNKRFLHCCHPSDLRPVTECEQVKLTEARAIAVGQLASRGGGVYGSQAIVNSAPSGGDASAQTIAAASLTLLEFHWPDSGMGAWGDPHTFVDMLPKMRPETLPGCRVVVTTVLRDPFTLYRSLQRHQYDAMATYGRAALRERCECNLTACDVTGFVRAFPNFQSWRLTSTRWLYPPLEYVGHDAMFRAATRLLSRLDLVGVFERLDEWVQAVCKLGGIDPCPPMSHLNAKHATTKTKHCGTPDVAAVEAAVRQHARADIELHAFARHLHKVSYRGP